MKERTVRGESSGGAAAGPPGRARGEGPALAWFVQAREPSPRTKVCGEKYAQLPQT